VPNRARVSTLVDRDPLLPHLTQKTLVLLGLWYVGQSSALLMFHNGNNMFDQPSEFGLWQAARKTVSMFPSLTWVDRVLDSNKKERV
jgi:hypothetical protein